MGLTLALLSPTTSMRGDMKAMVAAAAALFALSAHNSLSAQVFCASGQAQVDSARDELISVLGNDSQLAKEIRQEQKIASANDLAKMTLVRDRAVCSRVASRIDHPLPVGAAVVEHAADAHVGIGLGREGLDERLRTGAATDEISSRRPPISVSRPAR